jgi:hypothetical protein
MLVPVRLEGRDAAAVRKPEHAQACFGVHRLEAEDVLAEVG